MLLVILSFMWISHRFIVGTDWGTVRFLLGDLDFLESLAMASLIYSAGLAVAGIGWMAAQCGVTSRLRPRAALFSAHAATQLAKYLPGNVGQYIGRHIILKGAGLSHGVLVMGMLADAGLQALAAFTWSAPAFWRVVHDPNLHLPGWLPSVAIAILVVVGISLGLSTSRWRPVVSQWRWPWLVFAFVLQLVFVGAMVVAVDLMSIVATHGSVSFAALSGAVAMAWVAGFIVPGVPAGLGIREAVFAYCLIGQISDAQIVVLAASFRVAGFLGDLILFFVGLVLRKRYK